MKQSHFSLPINLKTGLWLIITILLTGVPLGRAADQARERIVYASFRPANMGHSLISKGSWTCLRPQANQDGCQPSQSFRAQRCPNGKELGWVQSGTSKGRGRIICACTGHVRLTGPHYAQPFVAEDGTCEIWGVGEAIGCVAPLAGDGIIAGMRSAQILAEYWNDPEGYAQAILKEFQWMKPERNVIDKLRMGKSLRINDAWVLRRNSRRMGMKVGLTEARVLLGHLG